MVKKKIAKKNKKVASKEKESVLEEIEKKIEHIPEVIENKILGEEKKENKSSKKIKKISTIKVISALAVIVIIVAVFSYFFLFSGPCAMQRFVFNIEGITYCSNTNTPSEFFSSFKNNDLVYVSPILVEGEVDNKVVNAMFLWQVVLLGNDINAVQLIRVTNTNGELLRCSTNNGDVLQAEDISADTCNALLADSNNVFVFIEPGQERVSLNNKNLSIFYATSKDVSTLNFIVIKKIFPNAEEVLQRVNQLIYSVG